MSDDRKKLKDIQKINKTQEKTKNENKEDSTKYGEFVSSYFSWKSLSEQKDIVNKLENITKDKK